jgi:hypothetical protein
MIEAIFIAVFSLAFALLAVGLVCLWRAVESLERLWQSEIRNKGYRYD